MKIKLILNRYKVFLISLCLCFMVYFLNRSLYFNIMNKSYLSIIQMLSVLPPIMIILGLIDVWISREKFVKYMGKESGIFGITISFLMAFFAAGPMYAAFPFTEVLIKKGVRLSNTLIFLNAWCVSKFSTLLFEISSLGFRFTLIRFIIDIIGIILMAYLIEYFINDKK